MGSNKIRNSMVCLFQVIAARKLKLKYEIVCWCLRGWAGGFNMPACPWVYVLKWCDTGFFVRRYCVVSPCVVSMRGIQQDLVTPVNN